VKLDLLNSIYDYSKTMVSDYVDILVNEVP